MLTYSGDADGQRIGEALFADYALTPNPVDPGIGVWFWRTTYDAQFLGVERSLRKHRNEWRAVLGLPPMAFPPYQLPRLKGAGARFQTVDGKPWQWRGATDFSLYLKFLQNTPGLDAVRDQRAAAGATIVRVLGMVNSFTHLWPQEHGDFYTRLPAFAKWLEEAGLYLEFSVFADAQIIMPNVSAQRSHFDFVCGAVAPCPNVLIELGNEYGDWRNGDYGKNGFNPADFAKPQGVLSCRGSAVGDVPPILNPWDYSTFHETRNFPGWVKDGNTIEIQNGYNEYQGLGYQHPIVHDEPIKMGSGFVTDRNLIGQFAGIVGASCAGATFHSAQGVTSDLWDAETAACAETFYRALGAASA